MRIHEPSHVDPYEAMHADADAGRTIDTWLNVVARLMKLPDETRHSICDELREHLRERVRDLLLASSREGHLTESDAVRMAIDELGETAHLARRFEAANQPRSRRLLMHATLSVICAGAVTAGFLALAPSIPAPMVAVSHFESTAGPVASEPPATLSNASCSLSLDHTLRQALESVCAKSGLGFMVDWRKLQAKGIDPAQPLGLAFESLPGPRALGLIARAASDGAEAVDWRVRDDVVIEFGFRADFDRREVELMAYDIHGLLEHMHEHLAASYDDASAQVLELLMTMVEPEHWEDNGGDLARVRLVSGRLFVNAPQRMQAKVKWILEQLPSVPPHAQVSANSSKPSDLPMLNDLTLRKE